MKGKSVKTYVIKRDSEHIVFIIKETLYLSHYLCCINHYAQE